MICTAIFQFPMGKPLAAVIHSNTHQGQQQLLTNPALPCFQVPTPAGRPGTGRSCPSRDFDGASAPRSHRAQHKLKVTKQSELQPVWEIRARETKQSQFQRPHTLRTHRTDPKASWFKRCSFWMLKTPGELKRDILVQHKPR